MNSPTLRFVNEDESSSPEMLNNEFMDHLSKASFNLDQDKDVDYAAFDQLSNSQYNPSQSSSSQQNNSISNGLFSQDSDSNEQDILNFNSKQTNFTSNIHSKEFDSPFDAQINEDFLDNQQLWMNNGMINKQEILFLSNTQANVSGGGQIVKIKQDNPSFQPFVIKRRKVEEKNTQDTNTNKNEVCTEASYNSLQVYFDNKKKKYENNIFDDAEEEQSNFHYFNKKEYENKKKQYILERKKKSEENKQKQEDALNMLKQKRKFKPIRIQQKAEYKQSLYQLIDEQQNFLFFGDFCVCKDVFLDIEIERVKTSCCPINYFRPPVQVIKGENFCLAQLDDTYNGILDVQPAVQMLNSLQCYEARLIADFLANKYSQQLDGQEQFRKKVYSYYNNNEQKIRELVAQNHAVSLKKALDIIKKLDQSKIIALHYKKIDPYTLTTKQHLVGGNKAFCNLFIGSQNLDMMSQFMSRWGLPHYMDAKGIIDLSRVIFEGGVSFSMSMVTYDDYEIPLTTTIKRINLHPFEIMPGFTLCDFLEVRVLEGNKKLLEDVHRQRYLTPQAVIERFKLDDFHYTIEAEQFINKYYSTPTSSSS